jgi:hypothetical protein
MFMSSPIERTASVAQQLSKASMIIRVLLILVLLVMIGAYVLEHRAGGAAQTAFSQAKEIVTAKKDVAALQQLVGRKPDFDETNGGVRETRFTFKGVVHDYTVRVLFNQQQKGEGGEEAHLDIFDKIKGKPAPPLGEP